MLLLFLLFVSIDFTHFSLDQTRVCLCVCLCVSVTLASDSLETVEVIIVKLGMVTASDMGMHHV